MRISLDKLNPWSAGIFSLSVILMMPILCVAYFSLESSGGIWSHLVSTSLPIYISNTILLMAGVGILVFLFGLGAAWLVTICRFPGRKSFEWLLIFPLAFPAYVVAYAYTDLLEYAGPVQVSLRAMFDWKSPQDYWFPEIRSMEGAILMMSFVLYPYVYLMARTAILEMSVNVLEVHRALGGNNWQTFHRVMFPAIRTAVVVGVSLALMETMNDFGTVDHFAVSTMTTGLVDVWLGMGSLAGAAQIAMLMLSFVIALLLVERMGRLNQKLYQQPSSRFKELPRYELVGPKAWLATGFCLVPIFFGFLIPLAVLFNLSLIYFDRSWSPAFIGFIGNSFTLSSCAALVVVFLSLFLGYAGRMAAGPITIFATKICRLGYAIPGAVLAIGIMAPMGVLDNSIDLWFRNQFGFSTGLLLSGSGFAIVFAYVVRFLVLGLGQIDNSLAKVSPSMDMAARTLGNRPFMVLVKFHMPVLKGGVFVALMLVFVDSMKEVPATLLLRPFNFETLATQVYLYASDEMLGEAALGSLTIVLVGLIPVVFLSSMIRHSRKLK